MKRVLSIIITVVMIVLLVGCSNSNNSNSSEYVAPIGSDEQSETELVTEAPTEAPTEGIGEKLSEYNPIDTFKNGFIWIKYQTGQKGLMNDGGKIVYSVSGDAQTNPILEDGYSFFNIENDKLYTNTIIDKEGNETFTLQDTEDEAFKIWAQGNDTFFISQQQSGFADIKYSIYAVNSQGEMIGTKKEVEEQPAYVEYIGNNMFFVSFGHRTVNVFNCNNDTFYLLNGSEDFFPMYNGTGYIFAYIYQQKEPYYQYFCGSMTYDDINSVESWNKWLSNHSVDEESYRTHEFNSVKYLQEGFLLHKDVYNNPSYFSGYDDKPIELPQFPETTSIKEFDVFSGGYLPIFLQGADSKYYVTAVDASGKQMYDPVRISEATWMYKINRFCSNGNVLLLENNQYNLVDTSGNLKQLSINPSGNVQGYDGDYVYHNKGIWSLKDNKELTAYFPIESNVDSISSGDSTTSSVEQKNYVIKNDFSIIGKWKNVGTYTFGQAQKGSIISFDGTNCNFFSPKDTYAFYKNGDNYKLDCTSPLADTVSFTVKIIDENNIDIFNGSDIVELTRVN